MKSILKQNDLLAKILFAVLGLASLGLIVSTDRFIFNLLTNWGSPLAILADLRLPSLVLVITIYYEIRKKNLIDANITKPIISKIFLTPAIWIGMTAYFVLIKQEWVPILPRWIDWVAFMITGLIAEEILFRGILFDLSGKIFKTQKVSRLSIPVLVTSVLFGLQHFSYHNFEVTQASVSQVIYTILMGVIFANLKENTGRLWPVIILHMITNSFTLIRNL